MNATRKEELYRIIFESETPAGKRFDVWLLWIILASVLVAMLDSVQSIHEHLKTEFYILEWAFTILFTLEYLFRVYVSQRTSRYVLSAWGLIDLLAILPTYLSLIFVGYQYMLVVRIIRLLRVFRILRLVQFTSEALYLIKALKAAFFKISIFFMTVLIIVVILGTVMYVVEGGQHGFSSIPQSIYWAIITVTTVGYGDIVPFTILGKFIASVAMIIGYAIIAVPTGIVTSEMVKANAVRVVCSSCGTDMQPAAKYCSNCGAANEQKVG
jgi:voltage-gated potassium channel